MLILVTVLCVAAERGDRLRLRRGRVQVERGRRGQARSEEELRLTRRRLASRIDPRRTRGRESQDDTTTSSSLEFTSTTSSSVPKLSFFTTPRPTVTTNKNRINKASVRN